MGSDPRLSDDPRFVAWRSFLHAYSSVTSALEEDLATFGLTMSQYEVLLRLHLAPDGRMRMQDLARSVLLSKSGVTRLVDRMVSAGLVERRPCESDRRVTWAGITDDGSRLLREAAPVHVRGVEERFASFLSPEEADVIASALSRVYRGTADPDAPPPRFLEPAGDRRGDG